MRITEVILSYKYSDNSHVYISQLRDASSGEIQPQSCWLKDHSLVAQIQSVLIYVIDFHIIVTTVGYTDQ